MSKLHKTFLLLSLPTFSIAQEAAPAVVQPTSAGIGLIWWVLISVAVILLFAILVLGNVLVSLTGLVLDKGKVASVLLLLFSTGLFAQEAVPSSSHATNSAVFNWSYIMAGTVLLAEVCAILFMLLRIRILLNELAEKKEETHSFNFELPKLFDKLNASVAVEKEHDVLLDHNYDGIQELDNNLPPWWKYSFYISIVWAAGYLSYYYFLGGPGMIDEYNTAVAQAKTEQEEYALKNKNKVDENNVLLADASGITEGTELFKANCAACHGNVGEGNAVGPNLTDDYWLHGGSLSHIFKSIKYGWSAKGMKAWQADFSATQIRNIASYIQSIRGSNPPNAKGPQGDLYTEGVAAVSVDSIAMVVNDSAMLK